LLSFLDPLSKSFLLGNIMSLDLYLFGNEIGYEVHSSFYIVLVEDGLEFCFHRTSQQLTDKESELRGRSKLLNLTFFLIE